MAFSTRRGRPPKPARETHDFGTAELRLKHALGLTAEPIDRCLERQLITPKQHWCGLHLRWLYTLRYGAPVVTTQYTYDSPQPSFAEDDPIWRREREVEYREASHLLKGHGVYEPVMRLCVYNDLPIFLNESLQQRSFKQPALAESLAIHHRRLLTGLDLLITHWKK